MQIAHSIDLEHVNKGGHHKKIANQPTRVVHEVLNEVNGSQNHWDEEDNAHDNTSKD